MPVHFNLYCATAVAQKWGLVVNIDPVTDMVKDKTQYTFMAGNPKTLEPQPYICGDAFPVFLMWKAVLDTSLVDTIIAYIDTDLRPESFAWSIMIFI
jgi:hypothetical protein